MTKEADSSAYMVAVALLLAGIMFAGLLGINATADRSLAPTSQIRPLTFVNPGSLLRRPVQARVGNRPATSLATQAAGVELPRLPRSFVQTSIQTVSVASPLATFASSPAFGATAVLKVSGKSTDHKGKHSSKPQARAAEKPGRGKDENGPGEKYGNHAGGGQTD